MTTTRIAVWTILSLIVISSAFASFTTIFPKQVVFFDKLTPNSEQIKSINNPEILFTSLGITSNTNISRARITVQAMPDCPENAPYQENVLQCFYISGFEFDDDQVSNAEISFKVPKEWIEANNYNEIELRRYSYSWNENMHGELGEWQPLPTRLEKENNDYNQYTAYSDGINYFSIVGLQKEIVVPNLKEVNIPTITAQVVKLIPEKEEAIKKPADFSLIPALLLSVIMLSIIIVPKINEKDDTPFAQLTDYIKNTESPEETTRRILRLNGWEDWQINLAINEVKK